MSGDVVRGFPGGATAAEVRAANRLPSAELESRDVHGRERLMRRARFPQVKSFEGCDCSQVAFPDGHGPADLESPPFLDAAGGFVFHGRTGRGNYAEKRIMSGNGLPPQVIRSRQPRPFA